MDGEHSGGQLSGPTTASTAVFVMVSMLTSLLMVDRQDVQFGLDAPPR